MSDFIREFPLTNKLRKVYPGNVEDWKPITAIFEPECTHSEIIEMMAPWPDNGMMYQCAVCEKKIVIPSRTIMAPAKAEDVNEVLAGILGIAFGEQWREHIKHREDR